MWNTKKRNLKIFIMKKKVVLFGSILVAKKCLEFLNKNAQKFNIFAVTEKNSEVFKYCKKKSIKIVNLKKLEKSKIKYDYGFSIRFNKILNRRIINKFQEGIINMHGGPLPKYRGSANHIFAIINNEKNFGVSLHFINENLDEGNLIKVKKFKIFKKDTGYSLLNKTFIHGYQIFKKIINDIKNNKKIKSIKQKKGLGKNYTIKQLKKIKKVNKKSISKKKLNVLLRAFYHPEKESIDFV